MNDQAHDDDLADNNPRDTNPMDEIKRDEELEEDNDTPFTPPDDVDDDLSDQAQQGDTNIDPHQMYDEGFSSATEEKPREDTIVTSFDEDSDPDGRFFRLLFTM
jgi:hypothetical protein